MKKALESEQDQDWGIYQEFLRDERGQVGTLALTTFLYKAWKDSPSEAWTDFKESAAEFYKKADSAYKGCKDRYF